MAGIDFSYTPGAANSLAANYDASVQNRNLLAQQARANEIGNYQLNSLKRADAERIALADAYKSAFDPAKGSVDETRLYEGLAQGGMGHLLPDVQAKFLGLRKDKSAIEETDTKTAAAKAKLGNDRYQWTWTALGNSPTPEVAIANIKKGVQDGSLSFAEANAEIQKLNGIAPQDFAKYRLQSIQRTLSGMDAANAQLPKVARVDIGGGIMGVNDNPFSPDYNQPTGQMFKKTPTFSERTAQGNLGLAQQRFQWEKDNPGFELKENEDGTFYAIDKRTKQATPITIGGAAPVATSAISGAPAVPGVPGSPAAGTVLRGKGAAMTDSQSNAALFGGAMTQAQSVIKDVAGRNTYKSAVVPGVLEGLVKLAPFGVGDAAANAIESTFRIDPTGLIGPDQDQQKLAQAQIAFATAYLRKTSGAAFGAQEIANTIKEFFPLRGEGDAVIQQKDAARDRVIEGMKISTTRKGQEHINKYASPATNPQFPGFSIAK